MKKNLGKELLEQARMLANLDSRKPKQASLRRSVSAAYYSLFHILLDDFEKQFEGLRRVVTHGSMFVASRVVTDLYDDQQARKVSNPKSTLPLRRLTVSVELFRVADCFRSLQSDRHTADYDIKHNHTQADALNAVQRCEDAHAAWAVCRSKAEARGYLSLFIVEATKYDPKHNR